MKILHYSLGFPPYRSGGLTKFATDLMLQQVCEGHNVSLLWPGEMCSLSGKVHIKKRKSFNGINSFEMIKPLPIPYDEGIKKIDSFISKSEKTVFRSFLESLQPDVIHVHTLMGLYAEFLQVSREMNIRIVFSAHDYFPICPKVTMIANNSICSNAHECICCGACNNSALPMWRIAITQTALYRELKYSFLGTKIRESHRTKFLSGTNELTELSKNEDMASEYLSLREHYRDMLKYMDVIHYNSTLTKSVYEEYLGEFESRIISITHSNISDNRKEKDFQNDCITISYLGSNSVAKGFYTLIAALDAINKDSVQYKLNVFFPLKSEREYIICHDRYSYSELNEIFDNTDVLVAPSICLETFGYTVLEALSYGVPVVVSDHVGAKDIIPQGCGMTYKAGDVDEMKKIFSSLTVEKLKEMNTLILQRATIKCVSDLSEEIHQKCYRITNRDCS